MKKIVPYFLLLIPLFTSGCFSIGARSNYGWGMHQPTTKEKITAAALDTATLPIQIPIVTVMVINESTAKQKAKEDADANKHLMPLLENNPTLGIMERWDLKKDQHKRVFLESFSNPKVKYTDELLEKIHQTCPSIQDCVFHSQSCSREFLARHFDEEFERGKNPAYQGALMAIVSNPNTPLELVEKVASTQGFAGGVSISAEHALRQRASK